MEVNNVIKKYIHAMEYSYNRSPVAVAKVICEVLRDKRIVFYGDGSHTKDVISSIGSSVEILGVVADVSTDITYVRESFSLPVMNILEIDPVVYDYVVLLGYWSSENTKKFAKKYNINIEKIYRPYTDERIMRLAKIKNSVKYERQTRKPLLCLVLPYDRRDFITMASEHLMGSFELIKIYLGGDSIYEKYEKNDFFEYSYCLNNHISILIEFLQTIKPEIIVFFHSTQLDVARAWYVMSNCPKESRFVLSTTDFFFNNVFCLKDIELANIFSIPFHDFKILQKCEAEIVKKADGIITNWGGRYADDVLKPNAKALFSSTYFHKNCVFNNVKFDSNRLKICYTGNLGFNHNGVFHKISTLNRIFREFLKNNFDVFIYNFTTQNKINKPYIDLLKYDGFNWMDFVPTEKMPEELSNYHFGINILNIEQRQIEILDTLFNSLFQAKMATYLAAGLPIIVSKEYRLLYEFVSDYKIGFGIKAGEISKELSTITADSFYGYKNNVREYQEKFLKNNLGAREMEDYLKQLL